jgi:hypothetical protein
MDDLSTERLPPSSRVPEANSQATRRESSSPRRRRERDLNKSNDTEPDMDLEPDPHQLDRLA